MALKTRRVKPADPSFKVNYPGGGRQLPLTGAVVPIDGYWSRYIAEGIVVYDDPAPSVKRSTTIGSVKNDG